MKKGSLLLTLLILVAFVFVLFFVNTMNFIGNLGGQTAPQGGQIGGEEPIVQFNPTPCGAEMCLTDCAFLNISGMTYKLQNDILNINLTALGRTSCFNIKEDNITLDGQGHNITATNVFSNFAGIYSYNRTNVTIKNISIEGFYMGISFESTNKSKLDRVSVNLANQYGVSFSLSNNNLMFYSRITNTFSDNGVNFAFSRNNGLYNNYICGNSTISNLVCDQNSYSFVLGEKNTYMNNTSSCNQLLNITQCPLSICGNGAVEAGEQCDDGNTANGDGCSASCQTEAPIVCGNGILQNWEECDDGNTIPGDGCSSVCISERYYRVFVTNQTYNGNLGGLTGADNICTNTANAANLGGNWKAWLSDSNQNASSRLIHSNYPYKRLDNRTIANNWNELIDGTLSFQINVNELGGTIIGRAITATNEFGNFVGDDCNDWTNSSSNPIGYYYGSSGSFDSFWTMSNTLLNCDGSILPRLYCFEQSRCGNRILETPEQCDDGNTNNGDGCSSTCTTETTSPGGGGNNGGSGGGGGTTTPQCRDGRDNDADGKIDYLNDTGCSSREDNSEVNAVGTGGCVENWGCSEYGSCVNGTQIRACDDVNNCGTVSNRPTLQQTCESVNTGNIDAEELEERGNSALLGLSIYLLLVLTFIVTVVIVSLVVKEARMLKAADIVLGGSMTNVADTPNNYAQREVVSSGASQIVSNAQMSTFLVFILSMAYYFVFVLAGFSNVPSGLSFSPAFLVFGGFGTAFLVLVLALIVVVLSGIRMGKHHPKSKSKRRKR